eukprot:1404311-Alexandrium_andersonii.AAC.1
MLHEFTHYCPGADASSLRCLFVVGVMVCPMAARAPGPTRGSVAWAGEEEEGGGGGGGGAC